MMGELVSHFDQMGGLVMKRFIASLVALGSLIASAVAADYPAKAPVRDHWSGFYLGLSAGYGYTKHSHEGTWRQVQTPVGTVTDATLQGSGSGNAAIIDAFLGFNVQTNNIVWGGQIEASLMPTASNVRGVQTFAAGGINTYEAGSFPVHAFSALARLGVLVTPRVLVYGLAGGSYVRFVHSSLLESRASYVPALLVGAGIETKITPNWLVRGEYRYAALPSTTIAETTINSVPGGGTVFTTTTNSRYTDEMHMVRIGASYLF
jgi:opacity protein-like surface antigen